MDHFPSERVRFGQFELNVRTGELHSLETGGAGQKLLLPEQPFQILRILVERAGEIVSREEIQRRLWPNDTIVNFGHSINVAIGILRRALADSAANPQYIETLARRGYRLLVATEWVVPDVGIFGRETARQLELTATQEQSKGGAPVGTMLATELGVEPAEPQHEIHRPRHSVRNWIGATALILVVAAGAWTYQQIRHHVTLSPSDTIVRADIDNRTGDTAFSNGLNLAMEVAFEQTPYLNILGRDKMRETLELLNLPDNAKVTTAVARQICLRTGSKMVLESSIADAGNGFGLELRAVDCKTGGTVVRIRNDVENRSDVVHALGVSAVQMRRKLGESSNSIAKFSKPLDQATSASPDALAFLAQGYLAHLVGNLHDAVTYYQRAIGLDSNLALAHAGLGSAAQALGENSTAAAQDQKAYELRERLTEPSRFQVETLYYSNRGELEKHYSGAKLWVQEFPRDVIARINFSTSLEYLGQYEASLEQAREALRLLRSSPTYNNVMAGDIRANHWDDGQAVFHDAIVHNFDTPQLRLQHAILDFLQNNESAMQTDLAWAQQNPTNGYQTIYFGARCEAFHGRFRNSRRLIGQAVQQAAQRSPQFASIDLQYAGLDEVEVGNLLQGERFAAESLKHNEDYNSRVFAALIFARAGKLEEAQNLADEVGREYPHATLVQNYCLPSIRAAIKLRQNDPAAAIEILRPHQNYDFAFTDNFESLYPVYIRGLAYLQMGEGRRAAAEFQKVLDYPGILEGMIVGSLARLQLARAQAMNGDKAAARTSYEQFLALWKDADTDIPVYKQAKAEYARLNKH